MRGHQPWGHHPKQMMGVPTSSRSSRSSSRSSRRSSGSGNQRRGGGTTTESSQENHDHEQHGRPVRRRAAQDEEEETQASNRLTEAQQASRSQGRVRRRRISESSNISSVSSLHSDHSADTQRISGGASADSNTSFGGDDGESGNNNNNNDYIDEDDHVAYLLDHDEEGIFRHHQQLLQGDIFAYPLPDNSYREYSRGVGDEAAQDNQQRGHSQQDTGGGDEQEADDVEDDAQVEDSGGQQIIVHSVPIRVPTFDSTQILPIQAHLPAHFFQTRHCIRRSMSSQTFPPTRRASGGSGGGSNNEGSDTETQQTPQASGSGGGPPQAPSMTVPTATGTSSSTTGGGLGGSTTDRQHSGYSSSGAGSGGPRRRATHDSIASDCVIRRNSIQFRHDDPSDWFENSSDSDSNQSNPMTSMEVMDLRPSAHPSVHDMDARSLVSFSSNISIDSTLASGLFQVASSGAQGYGYGFSGGGADRAAGEYYHRPNVGHGLNASCISESGEEGQQGQQVQHDHELHHDLPSHWDVAGQGDQGMTRSGSAGGSRRLSMDNPLGESEQAYRVLMSLMRSDTVPSSNNGSNHSRHSSHGDSDDNTHNTMQRRGSFGSVETGRSGFWSALAEPPKDFDDSGSDTSSKLSESSPLTTKRKRRQLYARRCARAMIIFVALAMVSGTVVFLVMEDDLYEESVLGAISDNFLGRFFEGQEKEGDKRRLPQEMTSFSGSDIMEPPQPPQEQQQGHEDNYDRESAQLQQQHNQVRRVQDRHLQRTGFISPQEQHRREMMQRSQPRVKRNLAGFFDVTSDTTTAAARTRKLPQEMPASDVFDDEGAEDMIVGPELAVFTMNGSERYKHYKGEELLHQAQQQHEQQALNLQQQEQDHRAAVEQLQREQHQLQQQQQQQQQGVPQDMRHLVFDQRNGFITPQEHQRNVHQTRYKHFKGEQFFHQAQQQQARLLQEQQQQDHRAAVALDQENYFDREEEHRRLQDQDTGDKNNAEPSQPIGRHLVVESRADFVSPQEQQRSFMETHARHKHFKGEPILHEELQQASLLQQQEDHRATIELDQQQQPQGAQDHHLVVEGREGFISPQEHQRDFMEMHTRHKHYKGEPILQQEQQDHRAAVLDQRQQLQDAQDHHLVVESREGFVSPQEHQRDFMETHARHKHFLGEPILHEELQQQASMLQQQEDHRATAALDKQQQQGEVDRHLVIESREGFVSPQEHQRDFMETRTRHKHYKGEPILHHELQQASLQQPEDHRAAALDQHQQQGAQDRHLVESRAGFISPDRHLVIDQRAGFISPQEQHRRAMMQQSLPRVNHRK